MGKLPEHLRRSITWDRGTELAEYARIQTALNTTLYFCDPHSPWQRGHQREHQPAAAVLVRERLRPLRPHPGRPPPGRRETQPPAPAHPQPRDPSQPAEPAAQPQHETPRCSDRLTLPRKHCREMSTRAPAPALQGIPDLADGCGMLAFEVQPGHAHLKPAAARCSIGPPDVPKVLVLPVVVRPFVLERNPPLRVGGVRPQDGRARCRPKDPCPRSRGSGSVRAARHGRAPGAAAFRVANRRPPG